MKWFLAAAAVLVPALAHADSQVDLLNRLHREALTRIELATLAHERGQSAFPDAVANDQRVLDQAIVDYAKQSGIALEPAGAAVPGELHRLRGEAFDRRLLAYVADSSQLLIDAMQLQRGQGDVQFRRVLNRALGTYREQKRAADRLLRAVPSA